MHDDDSTASSSPDEDEILAYAEYLGIDTEADADLLFIAEWALKAKVPPGWSA